MKEKMIRRKNLLDKNYGQHSSKIAPTNDFEKRRQRLKKVV